MYSNFLLGNLHITDAARERLGRTPLDLIARHAVSDHGVVGAKQLQKNRIAMDNAGQIVSRYIIDPTDESQGYVLVITSESWGSTTVQLESEPTK